MRNLLDVYESFQGKLSLPKAIHFSKTNMVDIPTEFIVSYLIKAGWQKRETVYIANQIPSADVYAKEEIHLMLPIQPTFVDYKRRIQEFFDVLGEVENMTVDALVFSIMANGDLKQNQDLQLKKDINEVKMDIMEKRLKIMLDAFHERKVEFKWFKRNVRSNVDEQTWKRICDQWNQELTKRRSDKSC